MSEQLLINGSSVDNFRCLHMTQTRIQLDNAKQTCSNASSSTRETTPPGEFLHSPTKCTIQRYIYRLTKFNVADTSSNRHFPKFEQWDIVNQSSTQIFCDVNRNNCGKSYSVKIVHNLSGIG